MISRLQGVNPLSSLTETFLASKFCAKIYLRLAVSKLLPSHLQLAKMELLGR